MVKELEKYEMSHNDIGDIERGTWRKYNPYNPYVPEEEKDKKVDDLKIESLDSLFEEEKDNTNKNDSLTEDMKTEGFDTLISNDEKVEAPIQDEIKDEVPNTSNDDEYDLQKELEAKFDELFGPVDDNE